MKETIVQLVTAFLGSLGFSLLFGMRRRHLLLASLGGMLAWGVYLLANHARWIEGDFIPYLLASAFAVLYAELMARLRKCPTTLFVIPAILPLVPGGSLYYAMSYAVRGQMGAAGQYGLRALKLGLAIAAGISIMVALREIRARR